MWWYYALLSAFFAALTAIFSKIGVENVNSNLATAIRTVVILVIAWAIVFVKQKQKGLATISKHSLIFLIISAVATGLSWLCYFRALQLGRAAQVAAVDKLSVPFVFILSLLFLSESFNWKILLGVVLIAAGSILMIKA
ncbi:EamA family transporter [Niabella soli]|uniref:Membrane protein n=1 Tax=Niabella soli DSM 19437 TaxID=929713 RepID=W0F2X2_9BACT|nr:EamA family transporter [Niabella soli]AHF15849.1 membrane protein [Niabella soli DSM 19437]